MKDKKTNKEIYQPNFIMIPYKILTDNKLKLLDGLVYGLIYWFCHFKLQKCTASNTIIAKFLNVKTQSVADSLVRLEKANIIRRVFKDRAKKIRVEMIPLIATDAGEKVDWDEKAGITTNDTEEEKDEKRKEYHLERHGLYGR